MGRKTGISWCDATWNPVVGCSHISPGCDNCYAENIAYRFSGCHDDDNGDLMPYHGVINDQGNWNGKVEWRHTSFHPLRTKSPKTIFVCSMGDLFHQSVPFEWVDEILRVIYITPYHHYMILTKRSDRMKEYFDGISTPGTSATASVRMWNNAKYHYDSGMHGMHMQYLQGKPLDNLALGVSAETQERADNRIPILIQTPSTKHFVSIEPMIGEINLNADFLTAMLGRYPFVLEKKHRTTIIDLLDLVICGGETGSKGRTMSPDWVRSLRDQCSDAGVPFHFKSFGKSKERLIDGREWDGSINWA